jgi:hypothetical protein
MNVSARIRRPGRAGAAALSLALAASGLFAVGLSAGPASAAAGGGLDQVAWATAVGGLQYHPPSGPDAGGRLIDASPKSDEVLVAGDWDGDGRDTVAWVTRQGGLQIHASDGPYAGGKVVHATPNADEVLVAGDWNGDGKDTVAWVTRVGGLQFHPADGPDAGGKVIHSTPNADEYLLSGHWAGTGGDCTVGNSCTPTTFASQLLAYPGVAAPVTAANVYAVRIWERYEGGGNGCPNSSSEWSYSPGPAGNPLNTNRTEPGSTTWNSDGVKIYRDYDGHTCWYWGLKANGDALTNGLYGGIISVLRSPAADNYAQCVRVAQAVLDTRWGTTSYTGLC